MYVLFEEILQLVDKSDEDTVKAKVWAIVRQWGIQQFNKYWYQQNNLMLTAKGQAAPNWETMQFGAELIRALVALDKRKIEETLQKKRANLGAVEAQIHALQVAMEQRKNELAAQAKKLQPAPPPHIPAAMRKRPLQLPEAKALVMAPAAKVTKAHVSFATVQAAAPRVRTAAAMATHVSPPIAKSIPTAKPSRMRLTEVQKLQQTYFRD